MKKIVKLTENDLTKLVKRVINEETSEKLNFADFHHMLADAENETPNEDIFFISNPDRTIDIFYNKRVKDRKSTRLNSSH